MKNIIFIIITVLFLNCSPSIEVGKCYNIVKDDIFTPIKRHTKKIEVIHGDNVVFSYKFDPEYKCSDSLGYFNDLLRLGAIEEVSCK